MKTSSLFPAGLAAMALAACTYYEDSASVTPTYDPGYVVTTLPNDYRTEVISGTTYYRHNDIYYRPRGDRYVVVEPPRGHYRSDVTVVKTLPRDYTVVERGGSRYYRVGDTYYRSRDDGYVIVNDPF